MFGRANLGLAAMVWLAPAIAILTASPAHAAGDGDGGTWAAPLFPQVDVARSPGESFEQSALGIIRVGDSAWRAYRGKYRDFVEQDDFLVAVGRQDLAGRLRASRTTGTILSYGGRAVALTGLVFLAADASPGGFDPPLALSLGLCAGGLASWLVSGFFGDSPVTPEQAEAFARRYNDGLRAHIDQQLQKPDKTGTVARATVPLVLPWTRPGAGGLSIALTF